MNGAVRLVNGRRASEGSVQICVNGVWGHVCGYGWYSNPNNARVVCRKLGYSATGMYYMNKVQLFFLNNSVYSPSYSLFAGSNSPQPIIYDRIYCSSMAQTLSVCSKYVNFYSSCSITYTGGVVCEGNIILVFMELLFCYV